MGAFPMGFVDLHSHVLPSLDDGVQSLDESMAVLTQLRALGFEVVCATPHQKKGSFVPSREAIDAAHREVREALVERGVGVELRLGAENFWDDLFLERVQTRAQPTYTGGRAFLIEIDVRMAPPRFEDALFQIRVAGLLPVLAHPERYAPFWDVPARLEALARTSAMVVDLGALDGAHGPRQCDVARALIKKGLAHALASDVHSLADVRAAAAGIAWVKKKMGEKTVTRLLDENPRRILRGELPD
jgi:protein-tyrosine phosphatase